MSGRHHLRVARPTDELEKIVAMDRDGGTQMGPAPRDGHLPVSHAPDRAIEEDER